MANGKDNWKNRRRMAWIAFITGIVGFPLGVIAQPALASIAMPYYTLVTFVMTAYIGVATWDDVEERKLA